MAEAKRKVREAKQAIAENEYVSAETVVVEVRAKNFRRAQAQIEADCGFSVPKDAVSLAQRGRRKAFGILREPDVYHVHVPKYAVPNLRCEVLPTIGLAITRGLSPDKNRAYRNVLNPLCLVEMRLLDGHRKEELIERIQREVTRIGHELLALYGSKALHDVLEYMAEYPKRRAFAILHDLRERDVSPPSEAPDLLPSIDCETYSLALNEVYAVEPNQFHHRCSSATEGVEMIYGRDARERVLGGLSSDCLLYTSPSPRD